LNFLYYYLSPIRHLFPIQGTIGTTPRGERIKALKANLPQYQKETRMLAKIPTMAPAVRERQVEIDYLIVEAPHLLAKPFEL